MALLGTEIAGFKLPIADSSSHWQQLSNATSEVLTQALNRNVIKLIPSNKTFTSGHEFSTVRDLGKLNSSYYIGIPENVSDAEKGTLVNIHQDIKKEGLEVCEDYIRGSSSIDVALEYKGPIGDDFSSVKLQYSEKMDEKTEQLIVTFGIQKQNVVDILVGEENTLFKKEDVDGKNRLQLEVIQSENGPVYFLSSSRLHSQRYLIASEDIASLQLTLPDVSFGERSVEVKQEGKYHFAIDARDPGDLAKHAEKNEFFIPITATVGESNLLEPQKK